jgi:hypothetical protein
VSRGRSQSETSEHEVAQRCELESCVSMSASLTSAAARGSSLIKMMDVSRRRSVRWDSKRDGRVPTCRAQQGN